MPLSGRQFVLLLLIVLCLACYVAELCDTWDTTPQPGPDTEFSVLRLFLIVGAVFAFVRIVLHALVLILSDDPHHASGSQPLASFTRFAFGLGLGSRTAPLRL